MVPTPRFPKSCKEGKEAGRPMRPHLSINAISIINGTFGLPVLTLGVVTLSLSDLWLP